MESQPEPTPSAQATVHVFFPQTFKGCLLSGGPEDAKIRYRSFSRGANKVIEQTDK